MKKELFFKKNEMKISFFLEISFQIFSKRKRKCARAGPKFTDFLLFSGGKFPEIWKNALAGRENLQFVNNLLTIL